MANKISVVIDVVTRNAKASLADFKKGIADAEGATGKFKAGLSGAFDVVKANAPVIGAAFVAVGAAAFKAAQGAAETDAAFSALNQIAGETIANDVAGWAEDGVKAFGMSERAMFTNAKNLANIGDSAKLSEAQMREFIATHLDMAADFAAFADTNPDQVIQDMQAAYNGSTETLAKYGVVANDTRLKELLLAETGEKVTGTLTYQERALAINLALKQKHVSIDGQWSRESGELNGLQVQFQEHLKNITDALGRGVLPAFEKLGEVLNENADDLEDVATAAGEAVAGLGELVGAAGEVKGAIESIPGAEFWWKNLSPKAWVDRSTDGLKTVGSGVKWLGQQIGLVGDEAQNATDDLGEFDRAARGKAAPGVKKLADETERATRELDLLAGQQNITNGYIAKGQQAWEKIAAAIDRARQANRLHVESIKAQTEAISEQLGRLFDYESATYATRDSVLALAEQEKATQEILESSTATAEEKEQALIDLRQAQIDTVEQAYQQADAFAREMGAIDGSTAAALLQREELQRLQAQFPGLRDDIQLYIDKLNAIPATRTTQLVVTSSGSVTTKQTTNQFGRLVANATGTPFSGSEFVAGEHGPEIVRVPAGSSVEPAWRTDELRRGGVAPVVNNTTNVINIHHPRREVMDEIALWESRNGPRDQDRRAIA